MKLNHDVVTTPPRPAATVMLLRDAPGGLEVFLVRRHGLSDVLGGAYVFPGGKVDREDADDRALARDISGGWIAGMQHHFVTAVVPADPAAYR